jgi:hypothetical protein
MSEFSATPAPDGGDSLFVTQHDLLPNKVDAWSFREITYDVSVDEESGMVDGTVEVRLRNEAPADGSVYQVGTGDTGLPAGTMREMVTIYSPLVLSDLTVDGEPVPFLVQEELGHLAYRVELEVPRGATGTVRAKVSGAVGRPYRLTVPVTLVANPELVTVIVNRRTLHDGALTRTVRLTDQPAR